ncbi:MAG: hypothetical protein M3494_06115 [Actinomycetota bacterium]|jgi:hypothetical protein|nr:hypothetical protein [Rubrobacter sp.]MDQ3507574.1 hypothetical protein [Actinomycetota bacterium]
MSGPLEKAYPNIAAWTQDGWVEIGYDDFSESFIRVLDIGGMIWEGERHYENVDDALAEADAAIAKWYDENM